MITVGVIGMGSFGEKRARAVVDSPSGRLVAVADSDLEKAREKADKLGVRAATVQQILDDAEISTIVVAVPNKYHMELTVAGLESGKNVLCEKPLSRTVSEAKIMVAAAERTGKLFKTGSNHRYFESVKKAYEIYQDGIIGDIVSFNGRIGNNGERVKNSWFMDKDLSGGGTLLDNGCHLLDIARWFMGDFVKAAGMVGNAYWKDCPVEDTATGVFLNKDGKIATINSSWRQLSGYFYFELNGTEGYITVDGRFDTHGGDNIYWQRHNGRKDIQTINYGHVQPNSYVEELEDFFEDIKTGRNPKPSGKDGLAVIKMIEAVYQSEQLSISIE